MATSTTTIRPAHTREERRGDAEIIGVDASPEARPGVPMEAEPAPDPGAHWREPDRQIPTVTVYKRTSLKELTPVFGTAQPPRLLSGRLRALAYAIPETKARHWALLLLADRIDSTEHRLEGMVKLDVSEYRALARNVARRPVRSALMVAVGALAVRRALRS